MFIYYFALLKSSSILMGNKRGNIARCGVGAPLGNSGVGR